MDHISTLDPHRVKDTVSINDVRRRILDLTKPLAEIAKSIDVTISNFRDHQEEIENSEASADDIKKMISIQARIFFLAICCTVCSSADCYTPNRICGRFPHWRGGLCPTRGLSAPASLAPRPTISTGRASRSSTSTVTSTVTSREFRPTPSTTQVEFYTFLPTPP